MSESHEHKPAAAGDFTAMDEPFALFGDWLGDAEASEPNDPNAMSLATVDDDGLPNVRMVLLKGVDGADATPRGFVFYTNLESAKGRELAATQKAALCFHWKSLRRQVRVRGLVSPVSDAEADAYFASRARGSRLGEHPVATSREPLRAREGRGRDHGPLSDWRDPASAVLVGIPDHAARDRVLARPALPPA
jgi:pyridoxamine 5'-phosphate oxidase